MVCLSVCRYACQYLSVCYIFFVRLYLSFSLPVCKLVFMSVSVSLFWSCKCILHVYVSLPIGLCVAMRLCVHHSHCLCFYLIVFICLSGGLFMAVYSIRGGRG